MDELAGKLDQVLRTLKKLREENSYLLLRNQELSKWCDELEAQVKGSSEWESELLNRETRLDDLEQYTGKNNVIISGIPLLKDEDILVGLVKDWGRVVGVNLSGEIDTYHGVTDEG